MRSVFVVGCPRAGTTLLQTLLATQGGLTTFTESHFFEVRLYKRRFMGRVLQVPNGEFGSLVSGFVEDNGFSATSVVPAGWPLERVTYKLMGRVYTRRFLRMLDQMAFHRAAAGWVEKTPGHLRNIDFISSNRRSAVFAHVIRERATNVESLFKASAEWGTPLARDQCARRWQTDMLTSGRYLGASNHGHVLYEDLVERPKTVMDALCRRLGISFDAAALEGASQIARLAVRSNEAWKARNFQRAGVAQASSLAKKPESDAATNIKNTDSAAYATMRDRIQRMM